MKVHVEGERKINKTMEDLLGAHFNFRDKTCAIIINQKNKEIKFHFKTT